MPNDNLSIRIAQLEDVICQFQSIFTRPDLSWALQMFMAMMDKQEIVLKSANLPDFKNTPASMQEKFIRALQYHPLILPHLVTEYIGEDGKPTNNIDPYLIDYIWEFLNKGFQLNTIVLVTGDGKDNFLKLVCELQTKGIKVIIAYPKKCSGLSANLERKADHFIDLSELSIM